MPVQTAVTPAYISASTNRFSQAADCKDSLVAYGSSRYIALWNTADACDRGTYDTLPGHDGNVTCVRFAADTSIVSGDDQGTLKYWRLNETQYSCDFSKSAHGAAISALAVHDNLIVTGGSDALVKIWQASPSEPDTLLEVQSISLKGKYPLSLAVTTLPKTQTLVLAIGGTDRSIHIFTRSDDTFVASVILPGHEDWVKSLAFRAPNPDDDSLVLASGSQDGTIRLWNIQPHRKQQTDPTEDNETLGDELLDAFEQSLGELEDAEEGGRQISLKRHMITVKDTLGSQQQFTITFDALLVGHEAAVTSLSWRESSAEFSEQTLLSTSTDSSLILWSPSTILSSSQDGSTSLWINRQRFGDIGGQRLGGFVGGLWTEHGKQALGWGWSGGWRRWTCSQPAHQHDSADKGPEEWTEIGAISGHSAAVRGISWTPAGEYLMSTGLDQTTRIHAEIHKDKAADAVWHEISRPQVHGYDILRVAFLNALRFVSIADEKVARVFEAPREFVEVVKNLGIADIDADLLNRPRSATVPPLGLSNKATDDTSTQEDDGSTFDNERTQRRPFEGELAAFTLWPEIEKVFGHGYESISLAVSSNRKLAATACKATTPEQAVVRVYDTEKWRPVGEPLAGHSLTVTGIAFSPDDRYVLSVSRDRTWRLFETSDNGFVPIAADKSHARIIWDCCWAHEGDVFVTASRDKTVRIWHMRHLGSQGKWTADATIKLPEAATAVALAPKDSNGRRRLAIGLESGEIHLYTNLVATPGDWQGELIISSRTAHISQIHQLAWRPCPGNEEMQCLASCSEDGTLKVLVVHTEHSE